MLGEISHFQLSDEIDWVIETGYRVKGGAIFQSDGMPEIAMRVHLENVNDEMVFRLGELDVREIEEAS